MALVLQRLPQLLLGKARVLADVGRSATCRLQARLDTRQLVGQLFVAQGMYDSTLATPSVAATQEDELWQSSEGGKTNRKLPTGAANNDSYFASCQNQQMTA